jgi:hypothetical protein
MTNEQAISILVQVAHIAQAKGILKLKEATVVFQAVSLLAPAVEEVPAEQASAEQVAEAPAEKEAVKKSKATK